MRGPFAPGLVTPTCRGIQSLRLLSFFHLEAWLSGKSKSVPSPDLPSRRGFRESWLSSPTSDHARRNSGVTARRFLAGLPMGLRDATVEEVRDALEVLRDGVTEATGRQYVLRVKSLLSYACPSATHPSTPALS